MSDFPREQYAIKITITGEKGTGKSQVVNAIIRWCHENKHPYCWSAGDPHVLQLTLIKRCKECGHILP